MEKKVILKPNRHEPLIRRHPWLFSGAVEAVTGDPGPGDIVEIYSSEGDWVARGGYSPHSQIRVRVWTWQKLQEVDEAFIRGRVLQALKARDPEAIDPEILAYREIHAESDLLPGVVVDRYGEFRVIQFLSVVAEPWRELISEVLAQSGDCLGLYERSDVEVRELEGLEMRSGLISGVEPPDALELLEGDLTYIVDIKTGHKTGFYLDQRHNRHRIRKWIQGGSVLDAFCYTGSFTLNALQAGASEVLAIDSSAQAIELAAEQVAMNKINSGLVEWRIADVFSELRKLRDMNKSYDVVILDPPRFAPTSSQVHRASRGYKDINLFGFKLLKPGGRLITFSCSGGVSAELFQKIVADAALDAGVNAQIREWLSQSPDHPVASAFPEGRYLKGLVCTI